MKKIKEIEEKIIKKEIKEITCDFCGKTVTGEMNILESDITTFKIEPGYGSRFDLENFEIDICDNCLEKEILNKLGK